MQALSTVGWQYQSNPRFQAGESSKGALAITLEPGPHRRAVFELKAASLSAWTQHLQLDPLCAT
jgi:hypothetical protein